MNNKKKTIILIVLFIILITGASFLYNNLSKNYQPDMLLTEENLSNSDSNKPDDGGTNKADNNDSANSGTSNTAANETNSNTESSQTSNQTEDSSSESKNLAPNFTVYDLDGNEVNLTDFFGKPIILNFWASWCGPCKMEMPDFNEAYAAYKDEIEFLMVNMTDGSRETVEKASSFIAESGYTFPVYYDTEYSAAITYSVSSLPTTYFLNAEGELVTYAKGAINGTILEKGISRIFTK